MERCSRRAWTIIPPGSSTATTGQESTVTFVMMIHTTAQCSEEILPSPQGMASTLVGRLSNPAVRSCFSKLPRTCIPWAVTGLLSSAAVANMSNALNLTILAQISDSRPVIESHLQIPEKHSEIFVQCEPQRKTYVTYALERIVCPIFPRDTARHRCPPGDSFLTGAEARNAL